jgi:hypothetical protein
MPNASRKANRVTKFLGTAGSSVTGSPFDIA